MNDRALYAVGGVILAISVAGLAYLGWQSSSLEKLDAFHCPQDSSKITSVTAFIIDGTDALPELAVTQIKRKIVEEVEDIRKRKSGEYGLLEVRAVTPGKRGGSVIFAQCSRGQGDGLDEWRSNPKLLELLWEKKFQKRLDEAKPFSGGEASVSPIMGTIQAFTVERFGEREIRGMAKRLFIVSDMMEHSPPGYSHYTGNFSYEKFKSTDHYRATRTDLHGAEVIILYVQRKTRMKINDAKHLGFWMKWVKDNKGGPIEAIRLQGLG